MRGGPDSSGVEWRHRRHFIPPAGGNTPRLISPTKGEKFHERAPESFPVPEGLWLGSTCSVTRFRSGYKKCHKVFPEQVSIVR
jgi:hypothetical protein